MVRMRIVGLKEFQQQLRRVSPALAKRLQAGHKAVSNWMLQKARTRAEQVYRPSPRTARAITARAKQRSAGLALSPFKDPRIFGSEFGSIIQMVHGHPTLAATMEHRVFPPRTGNQWVAGDGPGSGVGTAVFPVIRESQNELVQRYWGFIEQALAPVFPERGT